MYWIEQVQSTHFPSIYQFLSNKITHLDKDSKQFIKDLGLYLDESFDIVRSRGRLHHASIDLDTKFPILIPTKSHLAYLLTIHAHEKCFHGGVQETLLHVRMHYWMPKCRQTIETILSHCATCRRIEGRKFDYSGPTTIA